MSKPGRKPKAAPVEEVSAPEPKSNKKKFILIGVIVLVLIGVAGGGAAFFLSNHHTDSKENEKKVEKAEPAVFLPLEVFTVNLQSENGDKYLQTAITLQVKNEDQVNYYKDNMPQVRDRILLLLSNKTADELLTQEGKQKLSSEIIKELERPFGKEHSSAKESEGHHISGVFFTSFMIQ